MPKRRAARAAAAATPPAPAPASRRGALAAALACAAALLVAGAQLAGGLGPALADAGALLRQVDSVAGVSSGADLTPLVPAAADVAAADARDLADARALADARNFYGVDILAAPPAGACVDLLPTAGAVTRSPARLAPQTAPVLNASSGTLSTWAISLCSGNATAAGAAGFLRISRLRGCPATASCARGAARGTTACLAALTPPLVPGTPADIVADAAAIGPDELMVTLEGAEFFRLVGAHAGDCEYAFPFTVGLAGVYRVSAVALRADWDALDETRPLFPPYTVDDIIGASALVALGARAAAAPAAARAAWGAARAAARDGSLPRCAARARGRWFSTTDPTALLRDAPLVVPATLSANPEWPHVGPALRTDVRGGLEWTAFGCGRAPALAGAARACLVNRSMSFRGDSQLRDLYNFIMDRFVGVHDAAVKGVEGPSCLDSLHERSPHWSRADYPDMLSRFFTCFVSDPMGDTPSDFSANGNLVEPPPSVVVLNFGQHFASSAHKPARDYAAALAAHAGAGFRAAALARSREVPREPHARFLGVVWVETQLLPPRNDVGVWGHNDWRTTSRIRLYNAIARRALAALAGERLADGRAMFDVVETADVTDAVMESARDSAHLDHDGTGAEALSVLSQRLIEIMCGEDLSNL